VSPSFAFAASSAALHPGISSAITNMNISTIMWLFFTIILHFLCTVRVQGANIALYSTKIQPGFPVSNLTGRPLTSANQRDIILTKADDG
jgi:hypothetical protein